MTEPARTKALQSCPACDGWHEHEGPTTTRALDALDWWEGYGKCAESTIPSDTRWDLSSSSNRRYAVCFGGSPLQLTRHEWGAPFRRIEDRTKKTTAFARYRRSKPPRETLEDT